MPCESARKLRVDVAAALAASVTLVGLSEDVAPLGETINESDTGPVKLLRLVRVTVDVVEMPACTVSEDGETETLKS